MEGWRGARYEPISSPPSQFLFIGIEGVRPELFETLFRSRRGINHDIGEILARTYIYSV